MIDKSTVVMATIIIYVYKHLEKMNSGDIFTIPENVDVY